MCPLQTMMKLLLEAYPTGCQHLDNQAARKERRREELLCALLSVKQLQITVAIHLSLKSKMPVA